MTNRASKWKEWITHERTIATFFVILLPSMVGIYFVGGYFLGGSRIWTSQQLDSWCEETTGAILRQEFGRAANWMPFLGGGLGDQMRIIGAWDVAGHGDYQAMCHSMPGGLRGEASYQIAKTPDSTTDPGEVAK